MGVLIMTRGLPASGKTTWATAWVAGDPAGRARVNRDDLRRMMHAGVYNGSDTEDQVVAAQDAMIGRLLQMGVDVVCDDTNLPLAALERMTGHALDAGVELRIRSFLNVRLEVCLERNRRRFRHIPEQAIIAMHQQHVEPLLKGGRR